MHAEAGAGFRRNRKMTTLYQDSDRLFRWLTAYSALFELNIVTVVAGGSGMRSSRALAKFCYLYRRIVPGCGSAPLLLAEYHVHVTVALCRAREKRLDPENYRRALADLSAARSHHADVVQQLINGLLEVRDRGLS